MEKKKKHTDSTTNDNQHGENSTPNSTTKNHTENTLEIHDRVKASVMKLNEEMKKICTLVGHLSERVATLHGRIRPLHKTSSWPGEKYERRRHRTPKFLETDLAGVEI